MPEHDVSKRAQSLLERGASLYEDGKLYEALACWKRVLQLDPGNSVAAEYLRFIEDNFQIGVDAFMAQQSDDPADETMGAGPSRSELAMRVPHPVAARAMPDSIARDVATVDQRPPQDSDERPAYSAEDISSEIDLGDMDDAFEASLELAFSDPSASDASISGSLHELDGGSISGTPSVAANAAPQAPISQDIDELDWSALLEEDDAESGLSTPAPSDAAADSDRSRGSSNESEDFFAELAEGSLRPDEASVWVGMTQNDASVGGLSSRSSIDAGADGPEFDPLSLPIEFFAKPYESNRARRITGTNAAVAAANTDREPGPEGSRDASLEAERSVPGTVGFERVGSRPRPEDMTANLPNVDLNSWEEFDVIEPSGIEASIDASLDGSFDLSLANSIDGSLDDESLDGGHDAAFGAPGERIDAYDLASLTPEPAEQTVDEDGFDDIKDHFWREVEEEFDRMLGRRTQAPEDAHVDPAALSFDSATPDDSLDAVFTPQPSIDELEAFMEDMREPPLAPPPPPQLASMPPPPPIPTSAPPPEGPRASDAPRTGAAAIKRRRSSGAAAIRKRPITKPPEAEIEEVSSHALTTTEAAVEIIGVDSLMLEARRRQDAGDWTGATELVEQVLTQEPEHGQARAFITQNGSQLLGVYRTRLSDMSRCPRLRMDQRDIIWHSLDHRAGFLLSQVDGLTSFEDIVMISGMAELEATRILVRLVEEQVIG